ncbi:MAG: SDR family NAD(P)-dependent oxidoreductase [Woeseia sp.]|jgi:NAD(P)-dependent dehydrogenase (short-subunit alcohol dehydrogenase family)|nr:SDR family NAD(P)-dependent oxidoreductase [Woeseia sp.]MBT6211535.1 SDR family NAD(P)-dependent oxidoreductase [Woeseia sp.]
MLGPYSMSKHAVEAYTDTLAVEMEQFDVAVSVIEPGNYNSNILDSLKKRRRENGLSVDDSRYRDAIDAINERSPDRSNFKEPDEVSAAVLQFLFEAHPKRRYMVVPNQFEAEITIQKAIEELVQLNERHQYSYARDELITLLDAALENSAAN